MAHAKKQRQAAARMRYVGPAYRNGIMMPDGARPVRPATMTVAERKAFLARYPERASWWQQEAPPEEQA